MSDSRVPEQIVFPFHADLCELLCSAWFAHGDRAGNGSTGFFLAPSCQSHPQPSQGAPSSRRRETEKHSHLTSWCLHMQMPWKAHSLESDSKNVYGGPTYAFTEIPSFHTHDNSVRRILFQGHLYSERVNNLPKVTRVVTVSFLVYIWAFWLWVLSAFHHRVATYTVAPGRTIKMGLLRIKSPQNYA